MFGILVILPVLILVLSIPLVIGMVPRNRWYGFRTQRTLSSDAVWYPANKTSGIAMSIAAVAWLLIDILLPRIMSPSMLAHRVALWIGLGLLVCALLISFIMIPNGSNK